MKTVSGMAVLCGALLLAGCATPESRIKRNPEAFNRFPPDVQARVRQGTIDIGFSKEMVSMALGPPDRRYRRKTGAGTTEIWSYVSVTWMTEPHPVERSYTTRDSKGRYVLVTRPGWVDIRRESEHERLRVEFDSDRVKAIEHLE